MLLITHIFIILGLSVYIMDWEDRIGWGLGLLIAAGVFSPIAFGIYSSIKSAREPSRRELKIKQIESESEKYRYFATIPCYSDRTALVSGDFDGDGDLDFILSLSEKNDIPPAGLWDGSEKHYQARLYLFKNDGKGNFSQ